MGNFVRRSRKNRDLICYFGHHKCASTWIHSILRTIFQDTGFVYDIVYRAKDFDYALNSYIEKNKINFLSYTNVNHDHVSKTDFYRGFHVIRDPRDIVVSAYFSHLHSHPTDHWPELIAHRDALKKVSKEDGLFIEMEFENQFFEHMYNWRYNQNNVLELKMEELIGNPFNAFLDIFDFLGLLEMHPTTTKKRINELLIILSNKLYRKKFPFALTFDKIPADRILGTIYDKRFSRLSGGRNRGKEDVKKHFRKGVPGDWKNHFNAEHIVCFKEKYNKLLIKLGYESNEDW